LYTNAKRNLQTTQSQSHEKHNGKPVSAHPYKTAQPNCEEWRVFPAFFFLPLLRGAEEWRVDFTQRRVK
jgi:hypothetical protein